jgi:hypothetical protein
MKPKPLLVLNHLTVPVSRDLSIFAVFVSSIRELDHALLETTNEVIEAVIKNKKANAVRPFTSLVRPGICDETSVEIVEKIAANIMVGMTTDLMGHLLSL